MYPTASYSYQFAKIQLFLLGRIIFFLEQISVFGHVLLPQLVHDCDVGFHGCEVAVASPFHNHFRWYTETERVHYKSTTGAMCGYVRLYSVYHVLLLTFRSFSDRLIQIVHMSEFYARKHNPLLENRLFRFGGE